MDEQEIEQTIRTAMREISDLGKVSDETANKLKEVPEKLKRTLSQFSSDLKGLSVDVVKGEVGFQTLNKAVDATAGALGGLFELVPYVGKTFKGVTQLAAEGLKFFNDRLQQSGEAFRDIARFGAAGAGGVSQFLSTVTTSGLSLQQFNSLIQDNSKSLAAFSGTVSTGATQFGEVVGELAFSDDFASLRALGKTAEDFGFITGETIKLITLTGQGQRMTTSQLAQASAEYLKRLDKLAKLTGEEVDSLAARNREILQEARFRAAIQTELARGMDPQAVEDFILALGQFRGTEGIAKGFMDLFASAVGGLAPTTIEAANLTLQTREAAEEIIRGLRTGNLDAAEAQRQLVEALRATTPELGALGLAKGDETKLTTNLVGAFNILGGNLEIVGDRSGQVAEQQAKQLLQLDKLTTNLTETQLLFDKLNQELNDLTRDILPVFSDLTTVQVKALGTLVQAGAKAIGRDVDFGIDSPQPQEPMSPQEQKRVDTRKKLIVESLESRNIPATPGNIKLVEMLGPQRAEEMISDPSRTLGTGFFDFGDSKIRSIVEKQTGKELPSDATVQDALNALRNTQIPGFQMGGVVAGPKTGYTTMLHGTEAVIPMDTGQTSIPVELKGMNNSMSQQMGIMKQQLDRLDSMVHMLGRSNRAQQDMLQSSYS